MTLPLKPKIDFLPASAGFPTFFVMSSTALSDLLRLPKRKRLAIAERLWLSVADEALAVPPEHKRVLKQRLADYEAGRSKPIPHDELMRRVRSS